MQEDSSFSVPAGRRHASVWSAIFGYCTLAVVVARNIVLVPVYLRFISLSEYGAWLATGATLLQLVLTDFGLAGVLAQRAATLHGARQAERLGPLIGSGLAATFVFAFALSAASLVGVCFLPALQGLTTAEALRVKQCLMLAVISGGLGIIAAMSQALVRSFQQAIVAGATVLVADVASIGVTVLLIFSGHGLFALAIGLAVRSALVAGVLTYHLLRVCRRQLGLRLDVRWTELKELLADSARTFVSAAAMKLQTQSNTLLIGIFLGSASAGMYGLTVRAYETILTFLSQLTGAIAPSLSHLLGAGNVARFRVLILRMVPAVALLAGVGLVAMIAVNESFLSLWVGRQAFAGQSVSVLTGVAVWLAAVSLVAYDALYALARFNVIARTYVLSSIIHVVLLGIFLRWGLWVAPAIAILSTLLWGALFWKDLARQVQLTLTDLRVTLMDLLLIAVAAVASLLLVIALHVKATGWGALIFEGAASCLLALTLILTAGVRIRAIVKEEVHTTWQSLARSHAG